MRKKKEADDFKDTFNKAEKAYKELQDKLDAGTELSQEETAKFDGLE